MHHLTLYKLRGLPLSAVTFSLKYLPRCIACIEQQSYVAS